MLRNHKHEVLIFIETHVPFSATENFINNLSYYSPFIVEPLARLAGYRLYGTWILLWLVSFNWLIKWFIFLSLSLTVMNGSYQPPMRARILRSGRTWKKFNRLSYNINPPWTAQGDFNDFSSTSERMSNARDGSNSNLRRAMTFLKNMERCGLDDLGSVGPRLTWTNGGKVRQIP